MIPFLLLQIDCFVDCSYRKKRRQLDGEYESTGRCRKYFESLNFATAFSDISKSFKILVYNKLIMFHLSNY